MGDCSILPVCRYRSGELLFGEDGQWTGFQVVGGFYRRLWRLFGSVDEDNTDYYGV